MLRRVAVVALICCLTGAGVTHADFSGAVLVDGTTPTLRQAAASRLALGERHTCVLTSTNAVKCWGNSAYGQLGLGSTTTVGNGVGPSVSSAASTDIGATAVAIAAGGWHTCAITTTGTVKCWGQGGEGQLGNGRSVKIGDGASEMGAALPVVDLGTGRTARQLALGESHSCALLDNFTVKCWGGNDFGQLGLGDSDWRGDEAGEMGDALPTVNLGGATAIQIAAGEYHTCAVLDTNQVVCWGLNSSGQLGRGSTTTVGATSPFVASTPIDLGTGRTAVALALGDAHTCVVTDDLSMTCVGAGGNGRLGTGDTRSRGDEPDELGDTLPAIDLGASRRVWAAAAGGSHTCVLLDDATAKCFGNGGSGRLGTDAELSKGDEPNEMGDHLPAITLGAAVLAIGAGDAHTCAVLVTATVKCWGIGTYGALGLNSTDHQGNNTDEMTNLAAVSVTANTTTEPGPVRALTADAGETSVGLSWSAPATDGGVVVSDYIVEYREPASSPWITVNDGVSDSTAYTVTGLATGTTYEFRVAARNAVHTGMTTGAQATPTTSTTTTSTTSTTSTTVAPASAPTSRGSTPAEATNTTTTAPIANTVFVTGPASAVVVTTRSLPRSLSAFAPYSAELSASQRAEIARFAKNLRRGDRVQCVVHSASRTFVSRILMRRAAAACAEVRRVAKGAVATMAVEPLPTPRQASKWGMTANSLTRQVLLKVVGVGERRIG